MTRVIVVMVLGVMMNVDLRTMVADDQLQGKLSQDEREKLESEWGQLFIEGMKRYEAGRVEDAIAILDNALKAARRLYPASDFPNGHYLEGNLIALARVLRNKGMYAEAEPLYGEVLEMNRRLHANQDHASLAARLSDMAGVLLDRSKYTQAEALAREALAMNRRLHPNQDHPDLASSLNTLALGLRAQGKSAEAERAYREALGMLLRFYPNRDAWELSTCQSNLASALADQLKYAEAESLLREALAVLRRLYAKEDHRNLAACLNDLGSLLEERRKYAEAESVHRDALAMRLRLYPKHDHRDVAQSMNNLGLALFRQGKYADAETLYRRAIVILRRLYPKELNKALASSLFNLAGVFFAQGKYTEAEPLFLEAMPLYRALAGAYATTRSEGESLTLVASYPLVLDAFLSNARAMGANSTSVYAEVWNSKATLARAYERRTLGARAAAGSRMVNTLLNELTDSRRRRADLLLAPIPADPKSRERRDADLAMCGREIEDLSGKLSPLFPALLRTKKLTDAIPSELEEALPTDTAMVEFLRYILIEQDPKKPGKAGEKRTENYLAFVVTRDSISWIDLGRANEIESKVNDWREAIKTGKPIPDSLPNRVRDLVWADVRKQLPLGVKVVYISPDMALCRIPWAAVSGDKPNTILLEDFAIAVVPHATFLLDKLWPQDPVPDPPSGVLAVGGVSYDAVLPARIPKIVASTSLQLGRGPVGGWPALPHTAKEASGVINAAKRKNLTYCELTGERATTSAVLASLPMVRYAHFATHGFFADPSFRSAFQIDAKLFDMTWRGERVGAGALSPLVMTGLVFAGANKLDTPSRGIVTGEALVDLNLSGLDLVVLSACETGLGDVASGEGTFSLLRAFHLAGARNVIASLWKVPEEQTHALMGRFYRNLWEKDLTPLEALRQAQLEVYRNPWEVSKMAKQFRAEGFELVPGSGNAALKPGLDKEDHTRDWAAFTLSGPGR